MRRFLVRFQQADYSNFKNIVESKKTIETRAATPKYQAIKPGDILIMTCRGEKVEKIVKTVHHFGSLDQLFKKVDFKAVMPKASSITEAKAMYDNYPNYRQKLIDFGILAIELTG